MEIASTPAGTVMAKCERGLVAGMVVGGEPGRGDVRLADGDRAVVGVDEPGQPEVLERLRHAVVLRDDGEVRALRAARFGCDRQLAIRRAASCAAAPSTLTERRSSPTKSRLKADRFWVAVAVIVATPVSWSVAGS